MAATETSLIACVGLAPFPYLRFKTRLITGHSVPAPTRRQSGFTLIDMAIVLLIIGLIAVGALKAASAIRENTGISETAKRMDTVVTALRTFLMRNNRLPCPASADLQETNPNYVVEARTDGNNCDASTQVGGPNAHRGVLPVRNLGLSRLLDAWDRQFTYGVILQATQGNSFTSKAWPPTFGLQDESGTNLMPNGNGVVVIISHGANGSGAYLANGKQMDLPVPTAVNEPKNLDTNDTFVSANYSNNDTDPFDDQVLVLTEDQIVQPLADQGVLKTKLAQALEKLNRIENALIGVMISDDTDADGTPSTQPCSCTSSGARLCATGCTRTARRRIPYADSGTDGNEDPSTINGHVPYLDLSLTANDVLDPWGNQIVYQVNNPNAALAIPALNAGVYSGATSPIFTLVSLGPDGVVGGASSDDITVQRGSAELVGVLANAGVRVD